MKDLLINLFLVFLIFIPPIVFTQELIEKTLENNTERMMIENHYYSSFDTNVYSIIFVYCNGNYYNLYDTTLDYKNIGYQRYFYDKNINITGKKVTTGLFDEKLSLDEFISRYLIKRDNEESYNVNKIINRGLFFNLEEIKSILFKAQHNYDFLILGEYGNINLYLPENYPRLEAQIKKMHIASLLIFLFLILLLIFLWGARVTVTKLFKTKRIR